DFDRNGAGFFADLVRRTRPVRACVSRTTSAGTGILGSILRQRRDESRVGNGRNSASPKTPDPVYDISAGCRAMGLRFAEEQVPSDRVDDRQDEPQQAP